MISVYLAGSINGLDYSQATDWREYCAEELTKKGYNFYNPMRGKSSLQNVDIIDDNRTIYDSSFILERDIYDINQCNIIIANMSFLGELPMIGTLMELGYALGLTNSEDETITCYLFGVPEDYKSHPFFCNFQIHDTLQTILEIL